MSKNYNYTLELELSLFMMNPILNLRLHAHLLMAMLLLMPTLCIAQSITPIPVTNMSTLHATKNTTSVKTVEYLLQTSILLYEQNNIAASKNILSNIDTSSLTPELEQVYALQQATLALASNDTNAATVWLNEDILTEAPISDTKNRIVFHELRAKTFLIKKQYLNCVNEYIKLINITPKSNTQPYVDSLWNALLKIDTDTLKSERLTISSIDLYNWIDLALIKKNDTLKKEDVSIALQKWFDIRPNHPVPSELATIKKSN